MRIQREAYIRIAETIRLVRLDCQTAEGRFVIDKIALKLGAMFKDEAHGFDIPLFLKNCGYQEG